MSAFLIPTDIAIVHCSTSGQPQLDAILGFAENSKLRRNVICYDKLRQAELGRNV